MEPYIGDPGDEHQSPQAWYEDEEGYLWPTPGEGRVLVVEEES